LAEKLQKAGNATAIVSNSNEITDESMNQLFELLGSIDPSKLENNHSHNDQSENSNHSEVQPVHNFHQETTSNEIILNNTLKVGQNLHLSTHACTFRDLQILHLTTRFKPKSYNYLI
jgi:hypothetical protein